MKKIVALLLILLLLTGSALAEVDLSQYSVTNATVQAVNYVDITAPCPGTLLPFDIEAGDQVTAGDTLFSMLTIDVFAAEDGEITALFVKTGDDAVAAMNHYGCLGSMEGTVTQLLNCTTVNAYNSSENKILHVGETIYFKSNGTNSEKGTGRVIAVTASGYTVEVLTGEFNPGENLPLYRSNNYDVKDRVGTGMVVQRAPISFSGSGLVTDVYVQSGDKVKSGDRIMTLLPGTSDRNVLPNITAPNTGVIELISAAPGQQVWQGARLCRIDLTDELEVVAEVDEMDLLNLGIGSPVYITVDTAANNILTGQITQISHLGVTRGNAAYYKVHVSLPVTKDFMLGQSASLYLPKN